VVEERTIAVPDGTRILTVLYYNPLSEAEYWEGSFELAPLREEIPFRAAEPSLAKRHVQPSENLAVIPVARGGGYNPCVTRGRDGRLWAVFNDVADYGDYQWRPTGSLPDLWLTSSPDGKDWTRPDLLPINSPAADHSASLMQAEDGRLFLAWVSGRGFDRKFRMWISSSRDGKRWSQPRRVPVGAQFDLLAFPSLFQDREGTFWLVFGAAKFGETFFHRYIENPAEFLRVNGTWEVWMASSRDAVAWTEPKLILRPNVGPIRDISAMRDRSGTFHMAWGRREKQVFILSSSDGTSWKTATIEAREDCIYPRLTEMADGGLLLTYTEQNCGVVAAVSRDGKAWRRLGLLGARREGAQTEVASVALCGAGGLCAVRTGYDSFIRDVCVERTPGLPAN
jgi:hypothetical protein